MGFYKVLRGKVTISLVSLSLPLLLYSCCSSNRIAAPQIRSGEGARADAEPLVRAIVENRQDDAIRLINSGVDPNGRVGNKPVIYYAARSSHCIIRVIDVLVKHGADINARTISGFTALHGACEFGYSEVATYLLEHGADVNALDNGGDTPLHIAAASLDFDAERAVRLIRILIAHGAKIDARDNGGDTPADMAHKYGNEYLVVAIERAAKDKRSDPPR